MEFALSVESKAQWRDHFRKEILSLPIEQRQQDSQAIVKKLVSYLKGESGIWSLYSAMADEPDLRAVMSEAPSIQWVLPRICGERQLSFYKVGFESDLETNSWGLQQPLAEPHREVKLHEIRGFIIPALAYDGSGYRLGRGGGFYDQTLNQFEGRRVGVVFDPSFSRRPLPRDHHDEPVEVVLTPNQWIEVKEG